MTSNEVRTAYEARADEYTAVLESMEATHEDDRELVSQWSTALMGPVLDVGCGPGHWTAFMAGQGVAAEGVDVVPQFIAHARERFPHVPFRAADLTELGMPTGYAAGILAWYSLIHLAPQDMPAALRELARRTRPSGGLLVGFFDGDAVAPFPHAVTTAYYWPVAELNRQLVAAGLDVLAIHTRSDSGKRPHAAITARRSPTSHDRHTHELGDEV